MRQLELNLGSAEDIRGPSEPWKFHFTMVSLVENVGNTQYIYGLWNKLYGCWKIDKVNNTSKEFVPTWKMFDDNGIWLSQAETRRVENINPRKSPASRWLYEADAAFARLFSEIPRQIRSVVTPMGRYQGLALDLIWHEPELAPFIDEEFHSGTEQYVFACLALSGAEHWTRSERKELAGKILSNKRPELISELSELPCDRSALNNLQKLTNPPEGPGIYKALLHLMDNPDTAKVLCHATEVKPRLAGTLLEMPSSFQSSILAPFMLRALLEDSDELETLERWLSYKGRRQLQAITSMLENIPETVVSGVLDSLGGIRSIDDIICWTKRWFNRLMAKYKFPPPPFPRTGNLVPLTSAEDIIKESREMNNCLDTLIGDVLGGHTYFYSWNGTERATVMLDTVPDFGWMPTEALGLSNRPVGPSTELEIRDAVSRQLAIAASKNS
jgi:hypothetical protein